MNSNVKVEGHSYSLRLQCESGSWKCELGNRVVAIDVQLIGPNEIFLIINGKSYEVRRDRYANQTRVWIGNEPYLAEVSDSRALKANFTNRSKISASTLLASMPGKVLRVLVEEKQQVEAGQSLIVLEAMKMQNEIKSPNKGTVKRLVVKGTRVNAGDVLAIVE